jgi:hypothetical protein
VEPDEGSFATPVSIRRSFMVRRVLFVVTSIAGVGVAALSARPLFAASPAAAAVTADTSPPAKTLTPADVASLPHEEIGRNAESYVNTTYSSLLYNTLKQLRSPRMLSVVSWSIDDWQRVAPGGENGATTMTFWDPRTPRSLHVSPGICDLLSEAIDYKMDRSAARAYALTTVTHEALHALGINSEAQTQCYAAQLVPAFAKAATLPGPNAWGSLAGKAARGLSRAVGTRCDSGGSRSTSANHEDRRSRFESLRGDGGGDRVQVEPGGG